MSKVTRIAGRGVGCSNRAFCRIHIISWLLANPPEPMGIGQTLLKSIFQAVSISVNEIQDVTGARIGGSSWPVILYHYKKQGKDAALPKIMFLLNICIL